MALKKIEHTWLKRFLHLRSDIPGYRPRTEPFFFSKSGTVITKMGRLVMEACRLCGLRDRVTVNDIRSSVATHVSIF